MKYKIHLVGSFKKSYKRCVKRGLDISLFEEVVTLLLKGEPLPSKYKNHPLTGHYKGWYDCHIEPDWLLIWRYERDELVLSLLDTGSHSDIFG